MKSKHKYISIILVNSMYIILEVQHTMFKSHAITKITNGLAYYTPHNVYPNSAFAKKFTIMDY